MPELTSKKKFLDRNMNLNVDNVLVPKPSLIAMRARARRHSAFYFAVHLYLLLCQFLQILINYSLPSKLIFFLKSPKNYYPPPFAVNILKTLKTKLNF